MIIHLPGLGNWEGDSYHSQLVNTRMFVGSHHFLDTDLIYLWPASVKCCLYQMHASGVPSDSYALLNIKSGHPQPSPWTITCFCLQSHSCDGHYLWEELCNCVTVESAPKTYLTAVLLIETCLLNSYPSIFFLKAQAFSPHPAISFCICFVLLDDKIWQTGSLIIAASKWQASGKMIITYSKVFIKLTYPE